MEITWFLVIGMFVAAILGTAIGFGLFQIGLFVILALEYCWYWFINLFRKKFKRPTWFL